LKLIINESSKRKEKEEINQNEDGEEESLLKDFSFIT